MSNMKDKNGYSIGIDPYNNSDRAMASAMTACYTLAANSTYPAFPLYNKETADKITETGKKLMEELIENYINAGGYIGDIIDHELLNELLNYKPTKMKQFKNRFAVTGDIIQLLTFEKELIKLGYTLGAGSLGKKDVFNFRGLSNQPTKFITVGLHNSHPPGSYLPASNDGNAKSQNLLYDLSSHFEEALKVASEVVPSHLLITEDGVKKYIDDKAWCVKGPQLYYIQNGLDENSPWPGCKYFHTETAALNYINSFKPLLITKDGVPKFLGDKVWYIMSNWAYSCWQSVGSIYNKDLKYFDKEENLIKYIKENRPVLNFSKTEIEKFVFDLTGIEVVVDIEYPKDFVKRD